MKKILPLLMMAFFFKLSGQDVRPVRDDIGFCWQRPQMKRLMDYLATVEQQDFPARDLVAGISPHDDYLYAGRVYYPLFKMLQTKEAVIFGVTHGTVRKEIGDPRHILLLDEYRSWAGLGREVAISPLREWIKSHLPKEDFVVSNQAHALEHSIEALVPFLQYVKPDIKITPIMVTAMPFEKMDELAEHLAAVLAGYMRANHLQPGRDIFFLISSDANHYGRDFNNIPFGEDEKAHALASEQDRRLASAAIEGLLDDQKIMALSRELWGTTYLDYRNTYWCGKYDIPFGLLAIRKTMEKISGRRLRGRLFCYSDTYSEGVLPLKKAGFGITAPYSLKHWVGFLSAGFYLD
jgi:AmmeMemoRadiSam system protein B